MLARAYNRKIEIWVKTPVSDGFGGYLMENIFIKSIYAKLTTSAGNKFVNFGIVDFKNPVIFSIRGIKNGIVFTENHFVKYKGKEFFIKGTEDKSIDGMELNLLCDES